MLGNLYLIMLAMVTCAFYKCGRGFGCKRTVGSHCLPTMYFHPFKDRCPGERLPALHSKDVSSIVWVMIYYS